MLEAATNIGRYSYYHLITGVDFPLRSQEEIHSFYERHNGMQFISLSKCKPNDMERVQPYYFFQDALGEKNIGRVLRKITIGLEKVFKISHNKDARKWGIGSAYFDITDDFARYVVSQKDKIRKTFRYTRCADEMFLQTIYLNSPFVTKERYASEVTNHPYIQNSYLDVVRAIDWTRGKPYVYRIDDFDWLRESGCLFARKFDYEKYPEIIDRLYQTIASN